jgi:hypothetical protein
VLVGHLNKLLMGNATGTNEDHAVGCVVVLDVAGKLGPGDVTDVLAGTKDSAAQRLVLEGGGVEVIEDDLFKLLFDLLRLSQDNVALALDGRLLKLRVLEDIGENVDALWRILVE